MKKLLNLYDDLGWVSADNYSSGTKKKVLRDENGAKTFLLKVPKNFKMSEHCHVTTEQHFVLKGEYTSNGKVFPEGSYQIISAHNEHGPFESVNGALILVVLDPYRLNK